MKCWRFSLLRVRITLFVPTYCSSSRDVSNRDHRSTFYLISVYFEMSCMKSIHTLEKVNMDRRFLIIVGILFVSIIYSSRAYNDSRHDIVGNQSIPIEIDCALRAFTVEMVAFLAPTSNKANWTTLSRSALQMNRCNNASNISGYVEPLAAIPKVPKRVCHHTVFVYDLKGNDFFDGTMENPMKTVQGALSLTRFLRNMYGAEKTLCITIRGGTYYLGANATTTSSQIGAIALTSNDSNLVIENYPGEIVVLSGGAQLQLQWSIHDKTADGGIIMKAQVPSFINLDQFNELYIDGKRAIVAKYPNGDPSTQGLYAENPGFSFDDANWLPSTHNHSIVIVVDSPIRNNTAWPNYHVAVGGTSSVFNPPCSFWDGFSVPRGFAVKNGSLPHISNWTNSSTGFIHTFHGSFWGGWIFAIASSDSVNNTIIFSHGGFQEARGRSYGGPFYVSNIFEELDSPNEWFLDRNTRTLYFMPNDTMPDVFVASQIPCIISVSGSGSKNSANNIVIQGLTLTETTNTYMREYMVPSGGDCSVHRGGTIFLTNTKNVTITQNLLTELGSNGVAVIDYNDATTITSNEFVWLADSGIILVGTTNGIDGFSVASQPANTLIQSNIFHETGIYVKQSAPVLISVSRSVSVIGNVMFNMPRAGININDGYYGNHTISHNVIFNAVRETKDHGPINTWDRQPYLTDAVQAGSPSLWQHESYIHHNLLFTNYGSVWPIDHDDGSCFYEDSYNFLIYGGKKNYLGHSKTDHHEIYVYSDEDPNSFGGEVCLGGDYIAHPGFSGWGEVWVNNTCVLYKSSIPYSMTGCDPANMSLPYLAYNEIYIPAGTQAIFRCQINGTTARLNLEQWQALGLDIGTTVQTAPDVQTIIQWGRKMLQVRLQSEENDYIHDFSRVHFDEFDK